MHAESPNNFFAVLYHAITFCCDLAVPLGCFVGAGTALSKSWAQKSSPSLRSLRRISIAAEVLNPVVSHMVCYEAATCRAEVYIASVRAFECGS